MTDGLALGRSLEHSCTSFVYGQRYLLMLNALLCQHSSIAAQKTSGLWREGVRTRS